MKYFLLSVMCAISLVASAQGIIVHETNNNQTSFKTTDVTRIEFSENVNETTSSTYATKEELNTEIQELKNQISKLNSTISGLKMLIDRYHPVFENITIDGKEYKLGISGVIDLGISVKWAAMNVGASKPEEYGDYFAWGETEPKSTYTWNTYKYMEDGYSSQEHVTKYTTEDNQKSGCWYDGDTYVGTTVDGVTYKNKTVLDPEDDAAHVNWGGDWRMPTKEEQDELHAKCSWTWTTSDGVNGYVVTGPNGNSIFLPAAGCRSNSGLYNAGSNGFYWSSSLYSGYSDDAYYLYFYSSRVGWSSYDRSYGQSVRAVCP